jgi:(2R)-3-sulfolactate dehydrogenase (NADP+)
MDAKLSKNDAFELAKKTLMACGATEENAQPLAHGIIAAELEGIKSHGFHYLPIYCLHLQCQKVKGLASPKINSQSAVAFTVDADNGFAHRAITLGFKELIPAAKENGIASLAISNSYNCGVLGYHTQELAKKKINWYWFYKCTCLYCACRWHQASGRNKPYFNSCL